MFGKKLNIIFWLLVIPAIFFVFASVNFIEPVLTTITDPNDSDTIINYQASQFKVFGMNTSSENWSGSINWIILLILGILFSLIGIYQFVKFILLSNQYAYFSKRSKFPGVKKNLIKGQTFYNYDLFFYPFFKSFVIFPLSEKKNLTKFDTNTVFLAYTLMCLTLVVSVVLSIVFPLVFANYRQEPDQNKIYQAGSNLTTVTSIIQVSKAANQWIMYSCLSGPFLCFFVALLVVLIAFARQVIKSKIENLETLRSINLGNIVTN